MQERHRNRKLYFEELASTARNYYVDYVRPYVTLSEKTRVLEIGCGEGGNLLAFAEMGCQVTGIDLNRQKIETAHHLFGEYGMKGSFICQDFFDYSSSVSTADSFDLIIVHDVIEHISPNIKVRFMEHISPFLKAKGIVFFAFPPWQMPFGGHQQIAKGLGSKLPYIHLLPNKLYLSILRMGKTRQGVLDELMSIKQSRTSIEDFEKLLIWTGYSIVQRTFWVINPHYKQKFHLCPIRLCPIFALIPYVRNYYITSVFYLLN